MKQGEFLCGHCQGLVLATEEAAILPHGYGHIECANWLWDHMDITRKVGREQRIRG